MKEKIESTQLTGRGAYSTLKVPHSFLNEVRLMPDPIPPESSKPQPFKKAEQSPKPNPDDVTAIAAFLKKAVESGEGRGVFESRKVLEAMMEGSRQAGVFDSPEDNAMRQERFDARYGERLPGAERMDVLNRNAPESNPRERPQNLGEFQDLVNQAFSARAAGKMAKPLLEDLAQTTNKRASEMQDRIYQQSTGALDPESEAALNRIQALHESAMGAIKGVYEDLNPAEPGYRQQQEALMKSYTGELRELVASAMEAHGGQKIESLDNPIGKEIVAYIAEGFEFGGPEHLAIAEYIAKDGKEVMSGDVRKLLFEQIWERFVGRADKLPEETHYRETLGGLEASSTFDKIKGLAETEFIEEHHGKKSNEFFFYLEELAHVRQNMHDLNASFRVGDEYKKAVVQQISGKGLDFVQNHLSGVNDVVLLWEKLSAAKVAETHQWLSQGDIDNIAENVKATMAKMSEQRLLKSHHRDLTDWEIDRALRLGKITFAGTQRMAMYTAYGNVASEGQGRIGSIPYEYVARAILGFKMGAGRFFTDPPQIAYMNKILEQMMTDSHGKDNGNYLALFGADKRWIAANSLGAQDLESHGWRSQLMYLNNITIEGENGNNRTFIEFMNDAIGRHQRPGADVDFEGINAVRPEQQKAFHAEVDDVILGQRLYLSVLTRYGELNTDLKEKVWSKIAMLKPSTILSLLPNEMAGGVDKQTLEGLRQKLYIAEMKRVKEDTHHWASIKEHGHEHVNKLTQAQLSGEAAALKSAIAGDNDTYRYKILTYGDFSPEEAVVVKGLIDRGVAQSKKLSKAKFSQTLVIDDAPFTAWSKTGSGETGRGGLASEDIVRILFSDQGAVAEGWNKINGHVESPQKPPQEAFSEFVEKYGGVYGRGSAQNVIEPFIKAYIEFCQATPETLWFNGLEKIINKPGSEIAEYYRESHIEMDEKKKANFLKLLAQINVISDDYKAAHEKGEKTQLDRLREEMGADKFALFARLLRMIAQYVPIAMLNLGKNLFVEPAKKM